MNTNLYYIKYFCEKCNVDHYLLFTKNYNSFIELEDNGKPDKIVKFCKKGIKGFPFEGIQKYRFPCNEAIYLNFKDGVFEGISKGIKISEKSIEINKDIKIIELIS